MRVAAIQMDLAWEQPERNFAHAAQRIAEAAGQGATLVALPEMFATGFSMAAAARAEPAGGPTERFLADQARQHGIHVVATAAILQDGRPQNAALHLGPDGRLQTLQPKIHPFSLAGEDRHFAPGSTLAVTPVEDLQLGLAVCYDLRFPELFRALAFRGATLLVVPANWPKTRVAAWSHLLVSRAIENQCFVIGVNRVGAGGGLEYDGCSAIIDPMGSVLATARGEERILCVDLESGFLRSTRGEFPFLEDAREDLFPCLWEPAGVAD